MSTLKYQDKVEEVKRAGILCPPKSATQDNREAWRWVFSPIGPDSFFPPAVMKPSRAVDARSLIERCSLWALSMHSSQEASIEAFRKLEKTVPNVKKRLGNAVASGYITPKDGLCTPPNKVSGHFDLHPFDTNGLLDQFTVVQSL